jgi:hypothetical protein
MPRLAKPELKRHRAWLSEWRAPADMAAYVSAVNHTMGSADFFGQGGVEFLRDAWVAAEFGRHRQSTCVRLVPERERWPDFEARTGDTIERVECAEADIPGRRRGDEYRKLKERTQNGVPVVEHDPVEDWVGRADQVPAALAAAIGTKIGKQYASRVSLLILLNINEFGVQQAEIEAAMQLAARPALPHFQCLWILWKAHLYGPWTGQGEYR